MKEDQARKILAETMQKVNQAQNKIDRINLELETELERVSQSGYIDPATYKMYNYYIDGIEKHSAEAQKEIDALKPEMNERMAVVIEKRKDKRLIEIMKEKHRQQWDLERKRKERKEMEEVNRNLYAEWHKDDEESEIEEIYGNAKDRYDNEQDFDDTGQDLPSDEKGSSDDILDDYLKQLGF